MDVFSLSGRLTIAAAVLEMTEEELRSATCIVAAENAGAGARFEDEGELLFPHPVQQAAVLAERIALNAPFPAQNDRVATISLAIGLDRGSYRLTASYAEAKDMLRRLGQPCSRLSRQDFRTWVRENVERREP